MEKCSKNSILWIQRHWSISAMCYIAAQSASAMVWLCCSSTMPNSLQNQYSFSFAFTIFCISFLNMSTSQHVHNSDNVPPPQRIVAYICMNPKCEKVFANLFSYDQHRYHARNVGTLCGNVCELDNASRNRCDATRWRDDFSDQAHSTQRQAMRMHLHIVHVCYTQFQKNQTSGKLSTSSSKIIQSQQKLGKNPF